MRFAPLLVILPFSFGAPLLMGADGGCGSDRAVSGNSSIYNCECWTESSAGFTVGTPAPCASTDDEALTSGKKECTDEVGEACSCECTATDEEC